jgi:hypothetical protein
VECLVKKVCHAVQPGVWGGLNPNINSLIKDIQERSVEELEGLM